MSSLAVHIRTLTSPRCVKSPADNTPQYFVSTDAGGRTEDLVARERERLARQLHDEVASALFGAKLALDTAACLAAKGAAMDTLRSTLDDATRCANGAMAVLRGICSELRESGHEEVDLVRDLTLLLRAFERQTGTPCLLSIRCDCSEFEVLAAANILKSVREKLGEIARHSDVRRVQVNIRASERQYDLKIYVQTISDPSERTIGKDDIRSASGPKSVGRREGVAAQWAGVARKSFFALRVPRGTGPRTERPPSRHARTKAKET
jgi:hypothetical protein